MNVTISEEFTPTPNDMAVEFWESNTERQAEMLYSFALKYKKYPWSSNLMIAEIAKELDSTEREDVLHCLKKMVVIIEASKEEEQANERT